MKAAHSSPRRVSLSFRVLLALRENVAPILPTVAHLSVTSATTSGCMRLLCYCAASIPLRLERMTVAFRLCRNFYHPLYESSLCRLLEKHTVRMVWHLNASTTTPKSFGVMKTTLSEPPRRDGNGMS